MTKIVQFFSIQNTLGLFSSQEIIQDIKTSYNKSDIGKIDLAFPWNKIKKLIKPNKSTKGPKPLVSIQGKIAIMILKAYTGLSDKKLAEQINTNNHYRIFCRLPITLEPVIKNYKHISRIRTELASKLDWDEFQEALITHWLPQIENKGHILMDATCYESDLRYPTDVKLLWESLDYIMRTLKRICKMTKTKQIRSKYKQLKKEYIIYSRLRKKSYKKTKKMIQKLLYIDIKLLNELERIQSIHGINPREKQETVKKVLYQQKQKQEGEKVKSQIVSLSKSYIRPIVRGKETKRVEFGAKVNKIQIDGINIIEHLSFEAFHEGIRYEKSIEKSEELTQTKVTLTGADNIYGTNSNRSYAKERKIFTDFKRKGRAGKNEKSRKLASGIIRKARGSRLEGSFGVEKRSYGLGRIKARRRETEVLMINIGIHTKNLLEIGRRIYQSSQMEEASPGSKESA